MPIKKGVLSDTPMAEAPVFAGFLEHYDSTTHVLPLIPVHLLLEGHVGMRPTVIYRIAGGKIAEIWGNVDLLGLAQQIGVVAPPPFSDQPPAD